MGAGYSTKRGVINLELGPEGPTPSFTEAQLDEHIVGVVFSQQHSLKQGREIFGEKADTAITKELQQIHDIETYDPGLTCRPGHRFLGRGFAGAL